MMKKRIDGAKLSATEWNERFDVKHEYEMMKAKLIFKNVQIFSWFFQRKKT